MRAGSSPYARSISLLLRRSIVVAAIVCATDSANAQLRAPTENCNKQGYCYGQKFTPCYEKLGCPGGAWFREPVAGRTCYPRHNLKKPGLIKYWCFDSF